MTDIVLYQSVLQKLGRLNPNDLSQLDAFLSVLVNGNSSEKTKKQSNDVDEQSPIFWLEQLAQIDGISTIQNPVEWQRDIRQDRKLPFR
jgi:hypothetical protein